MRLPPALSQLLGIPCLGLAVLLSLPGIQAVHADDAPAAALRSELPAGAACGETTAARSARLVEEMERRIAVEQAAMQALARPDAAAAEGVVVLNNSGYNYGGGIALAPVPPAAPSERTAVAPAPH